jgi:hypothetical protein
MRCVFILLLMREAAATTPHVQRRALSHCVYTGKCGYCTECPICGGTCGTCCAPRPEPPQSPPALPPPPARPSPPVSPPGPPSPPAPPSMPPPPPYVCHGSVCDAGGSQWASAAEGSSSWGKETQCTNAEDSCAWSASQATNASDVDTSSWAGACREDPRSWSPLKMGLDPEWLLLNFSTAVWATSIEIFEVTEAQKRG